MEKIFNSLEPFFNDCYRRINVREYARIMNISPPTASSLLNSYNKQNILKIEKDKGYHLYSANQNSWIFIDLSRMYWKKILEKIKFLEQLEKDFKLSTIILFGSTSKGEITNKSDLDIAIFTPSNPKIDYSIFENKLKRKIQIFRFNSKNQRSRQAEYFILRPLIA